MEMPRSIIAVLIGIVFGYVGVFFILYVSGGPCTAATQIFHHPIDAITGVPWPPASDLYGLDGDECSGKWPSAIQSWFSLWLPLCAIFALAGALTGRMSEGSSSIKGAITGAIVAGTPVVGYLLFIFAFVRNEFQQLIWQAIVVTLSVTTIGGILGFIGCHFWGVGSNMQFDTDGQDRRST
jgi:hypothetical protein